MEIVAPDILGMIVEPKPTQLPLPRTLLLLALTAAILLFALSPRIGSTVG